MGNRILSTKEKALEINLDKRVYGSFAEIGAGQDVAANFFKAGGSSGTIAKTISAYDMQFSDAIYGKTNRYVCQERLDDMLNHEYELLELRLGHRKKDTCFFAFADTVEVINFNRTNKGHGWMGVRFQLRPEAPPNDCVIHFNLHDVETLSQQHSAGVLGVNLLYACFYHSHDPLLLLSSLLDNLLRDDVEIDMLSLSGPDFQHIDNRLMALRLVKNGLSNAAMFRPTGEVVQPSEALYKKDILLLRGRFRPVTKVNIDMLEKGLLHFVEEPEVDSDNIMVLSELTLNALNPEGDINEKDFLDRVDILCSLGQNVLISNFREFYKLTEYLSAFTKKRKLGIVLGRATLDKVFNEKYYKDLNGGILRSFGTLFGNNVKVYVYPMLDAETKELKDCSNYQPPAHLNHLFHFLLENNKLADVKNADQSIMHIFSDQVLSLIRQGADGWEEMVPGSVSDIIKQHCLFDYPCSIEDKLKPKKGILENTEGS